MYPTINPQQYSKILDHEKNGDFDAAYSIYKETLWGSQEGAKQQLSLMQENAKSCADLDIKTRSIIYYGMAHCRKNAATG